MLPDAERMASSFDERFSQLAAERKRVAKNFADELKGLYERVKPIIKVMEKHSVYFRHPDLSDSIQTIHGPIIGRNKDEHNEIYVFDGIFAKRINAHNGNVDDGNPIFIENFAESCDQYFAYKGLFYLFTYLDTVTENVEAQILKMKSLVNDMKDGIAG